MSTFDDLKRETLQATNALIQSVNETVQDWFRVSDTLKLSRNLSEKEALQNTIDDQQRDINALKDAVIELYEIVEDLKSRWTEDKAQQVKKIQENVEEKRKKAAKKTDKVKIMALPGRKR